VSKNRTPKSIRTGLQSIVLEVKTSYTTAKQYFERQEIEIPVFDNLSRKYDYDFAHVESSYSVQTLSYVYQKYFLQTKLK